MESGYSIPQTQGLSNNPYSETNQPNFPYWHLFKIYCNIALPFMASLSRDLLPDKILKSFLPYSVLATCPVHLNLLYLIILSVLCERNKLWVCHYEDLSIYIFILLGPHIRLRILLSDKFSLYSSLNVRDHVPQSYSQNWQCYCFIYFNFQNLKERARSFSLCINDHPIKTNTNSI